MIEHDLKQLLAEMDGALRALVIACETDGWSGQQALSLWSMAMAHNGDLDARVAEALKGFVSEGERSQESPS